ncbi:hypothetical protein BURMUCF2_2483 [Burkholderia multivorans CF2]|nr:hypothetical protein BURMUCF2_2483 [Burkholderia multivorans CF2]
MTCGCVMRAVFGGSAVRRLGGAAVRPSPPHRQRAEPASSLLL